MENNLNNNNIPKLLKTKNIKYPFSGIAPNLIDKFLVFGYDQKDIEVTLQTEEPKSANVKNNFLKYIELPERPTLINEICFNYSKESHDIDLILKLIFPVCPKLHFLEKKFIKEQKENFDFNEDSIDYSIIFSINPLDLYSSRKSFNGLGYIFYIKKEHRDMNNEFDGFLYYPITYVILSEFPYYYHFNQICKNIYIQMKKKTDEIPIDIILYNMIKYCPSPININLNLLFGAQLSSTAKKEITTEDILSNLDSKNKSEKLNDIPSIFFNQLSGYPIMDINLSFIFNLLEPQMIIRTFILTFLECDIIFFSSVPEILNTIMYIFANLNYPFNEFIYYWHIVSLSEKSFMTDTKSPFVGKTSSSMYGILCEYNRDLETTKKIKQHFILNIDDKYLSVLFDENECNPKSIDSIMELDKYISNCIPEIDPQENKKEDRDMEENKSNYFNDGINLYESIRNLANILNRRFRAVTNINYNEKNYRPTFFVPYEQESELDTMRENLQIQKAFYACIVQILSSMMNEFSVESYENQPNKSNFNKENLPLMIDISEKPKREEEKSFLEKSLGYRAGLTFKKLFKESSKYSSFLINFCQYHDSIDISKIPYSFMNEFIYFSHVYPNYNLYGLDIFPIIDQFYGKMKKVDFDEMIKKRQEEGKQDKYNLINTIKIEEKNKNSDYFNNISNFSYDKFETYYKEELRAFINREQEDDKSIFIKDQGPSKQFKTYKRNYYYLSDRILSIYNYHYNNNFQNLQNIFKLTDSKNKQSEDLKNGKQILNNKINDKIPQNENNLKNFIILDASEKLNKINNDKSKNNPNKDKQGHEKLFGLYDSMEISDLIEKNLIKDKYFSTYELMKFSLLSVIAVTINMKNKQINNIEVIRIMCDFCKITKSLVRRYMNIYLNIFTTMKINKWLDIEICDRCINIIIAFFKKTKTFPTEDTINPILMSEVKYYNDEIIIEYKSLEKFKHENKKVRETRAEFYKKIKEYENVLIQTIETVYTGSYTTKNKIDKNIYNFSRKFVNLYKEITNKGEFIPKTPMELYNTTNKFLLNFLSKFTIEKNEYVELGKIVLSLLYYFKMDIFLPKWIFDENNINKEKSKLYQNQNQLINQKIDIGIIRELIINIIYILLDLYEAIVHNIKKK